MQLLPVLSSIVVVGMSRLNHEGQQLLDRFVETETDTSTHLSDDAEHPIIALVLENVQIDQSVIFRFGFLNQLVLIQ